MQAISGSDGGSAPGFPPSANTAAGCGDFDPGRDVSRLHLLCLGPNDRYRPHANDRFSPFYGNARRPEWCLSRRYPLTRLAVVGRKSLSELRFIRSSDRQPPSHLGSAMPSSVIGKFSYIAEENSLDITFVSGKRYRYLGVPEVLYRQMRDAFSKGEFFNEHIRDHFAFERMHSIT
jgi:hypothetical protein